MWSLKLQIALALFVLTCGPVLFWLRRDNLYGYLQVSTFLGTMLVPLLVAPVLEQADPQFVRLYAKIISLGAASSLAGVCFGFALGSRSPNKLPLTFTRPLAEGPPLRFIERRAVALAVVGCSTFLVAYYLLEYIPLFTADRVSAKYGIGAYRAGFLRGAVAYHFSLALAAAILPILLALYRTRRQSIHLVLVAVLSVALVLTLSRQKAFIGPLVFIIALGIEKRVRPAVLVGAVTATLFAGAVFNGILFPSLQSGSSFAEQVAISAPDVRDGIGFVQGFERAGAEHTHGRTILAGLSVSPGYWDPAVYSLRITTGLRDTGELASGGIRLPAPLWGYSAFGYAGVVSFCALSGLVLGWATGKWKRLLTPVLSFPQSALNYTVAHAVFQGTLAVLGSFYFISTGELLLLGVAIAVGVYVRFGSSPPPLPTPRRSPGRRDAATTVA